MGEGIGVDPLSAERIVEEENAFSRTNQAQSLGLGREGFWSDVDNREVNDFLDVHSLDWMVTMCHHAGEIYSEEANVGVERRILARVTDLVGQPVDNFPPLAGHRICQPN